MYKGIIAIIAALAALVVGAPPASAYVTHVDRDYVYSAANLYEVAVDHHSNGVQELNVYRYNWEGTQLLSHEVHHQMYNFVCYQIQPRTWRSNWPQPGGYWDEAKLIIRSNYTFGTGGGGGSASGCDHPNDTWNGCNSAVHVWAENGGVRGRTADGWDCPWSFPTGHIAYGYNAPLASFGTWNTWGHWLL